MAKKIAFKWVDSPSSAPDGGNYASIATHGHSDDGNPYFWALNAWEDGWEVAAVYPSCMAVVSGTSTNRERAKNTARLVQPILALLLDDFKITDAIVPDLRERNGGPSVEKLRELGATVTNLAQ